MRCVCAVHKSVYAKIHKHCSDGETVLRAKKNKDRTDEDKEEDKEENDRINSGMILFRVSE